MSSLAHTVFSFWILVHNQFKLYRVGRVWGFFWGGVKMKSQSETERSSTCLLCFKLREEKKLHGSRGRRSNCCRGGSPPPPPPGWVIPHGDPARGRIFPAGSHIHTAGGWAGSGDPFSTLIRGNSQPLMEAIKQYRSHIIVLDNQDGHTCRSVWSAATPCRRFNGI